MTRATTLPLRRTAPTTMVLPVPPVPPIPPRPPGPCACSLPCPRHTFRPLRRRRSACEIAALAAGADTVAHVPSGFVGPEPECAKDLQCADTLLAGKHQMDHAEPIAQRFVRVLEDCIYEYREAIRRLRCAVVALPVKRLRAMFVRLKTAARAAHRAIRPAVANQICLTRVFVWKLPLELGNRHLMNSVVRGLRFLSHLLPPMTTEAFHHGER